MVEKLRTQANQLFQLGKSHLAVDTKRSELLGMRRLEVVGDQLGKVRQVWKSQTLEEIPPALPAEVVRRQPFEGCIFEVVQVLPLGHRIGPQGLPRDKFGVQARRQIGWQVAQLFLMVETQIQVSPEVCQRALGIA